MEEWLKEKQVVQLFDSWGKRRGLYQATEELAAALDALASALSLPHRSHLFKINQQLTRQSHELVLTPLQRETTESVLPTLNQLVRAAKLKQAKFHRCLKKENTRLNQEATQFAQQNIPYSWPWPPEELLDVFMRQLVGHAFFGRKITREYGIRRASPPSLPQISAKIKSLEQRNLDNKEAREELVKFIKMPVQKQPEPIHTRMPRNSGKEGLKRNTKWFYQNKIKKESQISLGRKYQADLHPRHISDGRPLVHRGIKEVERLLNLTPPYK